MSNDPIHRAKELTDRGSAAHAAGEFREAIDLYRAAVDLDPSLGVAEVELFVAANWLELGEDDEAIRSYQIVIDELPNNEEAWWAMAQALHRRGRHIEGDRASANHDKFVTLNRVGRPGDEGRETTELADRAFAEFQESDDLEDRTALLFDLLAIDDHRVGDMMPSFLATAGDSDLENCSLDACSAVITALIEVGQQRYAGIFSDGPGPNRPYIKEQVARYLSTPDPTEKKRGLFSWLFS